MAIAKAFAARHFRNIRFHTRLNFRLDRIADHVLAEKQGTIGREIDVRECALWKIPDHHSTIAMQVENHMVMTVKCPQHTTRIELETTDQMRGLRQANIRLECEVRAVLTDVSDTSVIVGGIIQLRHCNENVAPHPGFEFRTHTCTFKP
jgi:hypothetical protein